MTVVRKSVQLEVLRSGADELGVTLSSAQLDRFRRYQEELAQWNRTMNLTSAKALAEIERVHFLDSLTLVPVLRKWLPGAQKLADVGTGAGFPGVPLKLVLPQLRLVLIEATQKKAGFLKWLVTDLALEEVTVVALRAEEVGHHPGYREESDVVTARATGGLATVLELTLPLCRVGGLVLAPRRGDVQGDVAKATRAIETLGGRLQAAESIRVTGLAEDTAIVVVEKIAPTPGEYPRRPGMPAKRPL